METIEPNQVLRWLDFGAALAVEMKQDRATYRDVIWTLFVDALDLLDRGPSSRSRLIERIDSRIPGIGSALSEREAERSRAMMMLAGHHEVASAGRHMLSPDDEMRVAGVLCWMRYIDHRLYPMAYRKAFLSLARNNDRLAFEQIWLEAYRQAGSRRITEKPMSASMVCYYKAKAIDMIVDGLRRDYGVTLGPVAS